MQRRNDSSADYLSQRATSNLVSANIRCFPNIFWVSRIADAAHKYSLDILFRLRGRQWLLPASCVAAIHKLVNSADAGSSLPFASFLCRGYCIHRNHRSKDLCTASATMHRIRREIHQAYCKCSGAVIQDVGKRHSKYRCQSKQDEILVWYAESFKITIQTNNANVACGEDLGSVETRRVLVARCGINPNRFMGHINSIETNHTWVEWWTPDAGKEHRRPGLGISRRRRDTCGTQRCQSKQIYAPHKFPESVTV